MLPETFDVLKQVGLVSSERMAMKIAAELIGHNVTSINDIDANALIVDELRVAMCGDQYSDVVVDELNDRIGELTRPMNAVYWALDALNHANGNGHMGYSLCTTQVYRKTQTAAGVKVVVRKMGRFVSDDPDVVAQFRIGPALQRIERAIERANDMILEDTRRIPALATRTPGLIGRVHKTVQLQLPTTPNGPGQ